VRDAVLVWVDRDGLYEHIDARVDRMMAEGYLDEVRGLLARYDRALKPMQSLGYEHLAAHLAGELPLAEAVRLTKRDTRHLARKQRMFCRGLGLAPLHADDPAVQRFSEDAFPA
jgi:tRNA dimethylallyltransferase